MNGAHARQSNDGELHARDLAVDPAARLVRAAPAGTSRTGRRRCSPGRAGSGCACPGSRPCRTSSSSRRLQSCAQQVDQGIARYRRAGVVADVLTAANSRPSGAALRLMWSSAARLPKSAVSCVQARVGLRHRRDTRSSRRVVVGRRPGSGDLIRVQTPIMLPKWTIDEMSLPETFAARARAARRCRPDIVRADAVRDVDAAASGAGGRRAAAPRHVREVNVAHSVPAESLSITRSRDRTCSPAGRSHREAGVGRVRLRRSRCRRSGTGAPRGRASSSPRARC